MKNLLKVVLSLVLVSSLAFAIEGMTLKLNMKNAGSQLRVITNNLNDPTKLQSNTDAAEKLIGFLVAAKDQAPEGANVEEFQALMNQTIEEAVNLHKALLTNDIAGAQAAISKLSILKKEGHDKFEE